MEKQAIRQDVYDLLGVTADGFSGGGTQAFKDVPYENIKQVAEILGEAFLDETQGFSPETREFLEELEPYAAKTKFGGYVVSPDREDERVTIEEVTTSATEGTIEFLRHADTFDLDLEGDRLYAHYD